MTFGGLHTMWIVVMFDLPTDTPEARHEYSVFRYHLLNDGFMMMQYSVYIRHCASEENAEVHIKRIKAELPPDGEVRILKITDKQFGKMQVYYGKIRKPTEQAPEQLSLYLNFKK